MGINELDGKQNVIREYLLQGGSSEVPEVPFETVFPAVGQEVDPISLVDAVDANPDSWKARVSTPSARERIAAARLKVRANHQPSPHS